MRKMQKGVTITGLLIGSIIVAVVALLAIKTVPEYTEYYQIVETLKIITAPGKDKSSVEAIRKAYDRQANVSSITAITGDDLQITKENGRVVISFAYERRIGLVGNAMLLLDFKSTVKE